jgi:hypothetical protein
MTTTPKPTHWLFRIGDGKHFDSSSKYKIWGINSKNTCCKNFMKKVKEDDILWFIKSGSRGLIYSVAKFVSYNERIIGPLITISKTNEELGWTNFEGFWDIEIHYKDVLFLSEVNLLTCIKGPCTIRVYNEKCKIDLEQEYINVYKYSQIQ